LTRLAAVPSRPKAGGDDIGLRSKDLAAGSVFEPSASQAELRRNARTGAALCAAAALVGLLACASVLAASHRDPTAARASPWASWWWVFAFALGVTGLAVAKRTWNHVRRASMKGHFLEDYRRLWTLSILLAAVVPMTFVAFFVVLPVIVSIDSGQY